MSSLPAIPGRRLTNVLLLECTIGSAALSVLDLCRPGSPWRFSEDLEDGGAYGSHGGAHRASLLPADACRVPRL